MTLIPVSHRPFYPQDLSATSLYLQISSGLRSQPVCTFNCLGAKPVDFSESLSTLTSLYKRQWLILSNAKCRTVTLLIIYKWHWVKKTTSKHCHSSNLKSTCNVYQRTEGHPWVPLNLCLEFGYLFSSENAYPAIGSNNLISLSSPFLHSQFQSSFQCMIYSTLREHHRRVLNEKNVFIFQMPNFLSQY